MMANVITTEALIAQFQYALDNDWGYIWGTAGEMWTAAKQRSLEKTTDADREMGRKYGSRWIGHMVTDCSGLFVWAYKKLDGISMYHGSDTMYRSYCTSHGALNKGKRTDGYDLKVGSAVFTYNKTKKRYGHVGLFIGNGMVIEAAGTIDGVIASPVDKKWTYWGELKGVKYEGGEQPVPEGYAIVTGKKVALRTAPSKSASIITRVDTGKTVKLETPPPMEWEYVSFNGKEGYMMKEFLKE